MANQHNPNLLPLFLYLNPFWIIKVAFIHFTLLLRNPYPHSSYTENYMGKDRNIMPFLLYNLQLIIKRFFSNKLQTIEIQKKEVTAFIYI
jgi:hypothetical protein